MGPTDPSHVVWAIIKSLVEVLGLQVVVVVVVVVVVLLLPFFVLLVVVVVDFVVVVVVGGVVLRMRWRSLAVTYV